MTTAENAKIEVQLAWEKSEWAFAVYVMHAERGCLESQRFEYDLDKAGDLGRARTEAKARFRQAVAALPGCNHYVDA